MNQSRSVPPLRIAVLGDFEGMHTRRWVEAFVQRGHDMHAISFYAPREEIPGMTLHVLTAGDPPSTRSEAQRDDRPSIGINARPRERLVRVLKKAAPPSLQRVIQARRFARAGLRRVLDGIEPDVFHAHFAVEHGFYGSFADFHPYVVSAWGSDLLVESRSFLGKLVARRALASADLVTANDASLAQRAGELGVPEDRIEVVYLGIDRLFLDAGVHSANLPHATRRPPTIISTRSHESLYNIDIVLRAFALTRKVVPDARLIVAGMGSQTGDLKALARALALGDGVQFVGQQPALQLAGLLSDAHVYVSAPSSDSFALSNAEAMAAGAFPVVSDLPSVDGWLEDGMTGLRVPPGSVDALASALTRALTDNAMRLAAFAPNRARVEAGGLRERNMLLLERHYYRLAGHPQAGAGEAI